jgi:Flp pilus assembly pilin Flp
MKNLLARFIAGNSGATAVEYALLCALIAAAMIGPVLLLSGDVGEVFAKAGNATPQP